MKLTQEQKESLFNIYMKFDGTETGAMQHVVDAYEKMRPSDSDEWISVKERLPKEEDAYLHVVLWYSRFQNGGVEIASFKNGMQATHWKRIIPPVITPPTLEEVERPKFEAWGSDHGIHLIRSGEKYGGSIANALWDGWMARAKSEQSAKA